MSTFLHRPHWCPYVAFYIAVVFLNRLHYDTYVSEITHLVSFVFLVHISKFPRLESQSDTDFSLSRQPI